MKIRSALVTVSASIAVVLLSACAGSSGETSGAAGSPAAGSPGNLGGGGASAGMPGAAGAPISAAGSGGAEASSGGNLTAAGAAGSSTAGSGGTSSGGAAGNSGAAGSGRAIVAPIPDTKSVMYLPNWNGSFSSWASKIDFKKMTHLNLAFGTSKGNDWNLAADADVKAIAKAAHAANVKVLVSIGGASDDLGICTQYHTASNIDPMIANLDAMVNRMDLDGVDVDIERGNEMKMSGNFPQFLSKLEAKMHGEGKLVTAATAQYIVEDTGASDAGVIAYLKSYDFINLMIYAFDADMHTYTQELSWWDSKIGMPKKNMTWGIEFDPRLNTDLAAKLTTASKAYGGIMVWEYSQGTEKTLWPAVQGAL